MLRDDSSFIPLVTHDGRLTGKGGSILKPLVSSLRFARFGLLSRSSLFLTTCVGWGRGEIISPEKENTKKVTQTVVLCHSRSSQNTQIVPGSERGGSAGRQKKNTKTRQSGATIEWPDYPDHSPALSGGCTHEEIRNTQPGTRTQKRVLGHNRAALLPRPAPALSGGGGVLICCLP